MLPGQALVRFETHEEAERSVSDMGRRASLVYNTTAYAVDERTEILHKSNAKSSIGIGLRGYFGPPVIHTAPPNSSLAVGDRILSVNSVTVTSWHHGIRLLQSAPAGEVQVGVRRSPEKYSGWCTFEQGASTMVAAHLAAAKRQAEAQGKQLPERFVRVVEGPRPKVAEIMREDGSLRVREVGEDETPETLLDATTETIGGATFIGKGEDAEVQQMLAKLEWTIHTAMEEIRRAQHANAHAPHDRPELS